MRLCSDRVPTVEGMRSDREDIAATARERPSFSEISYESGSSHPAAAPNRATSAGIRILLWHDAHRLYVLAMMIVAYAMTGKKA